MGWATLLDMPVISSLHLHQPKLLAIYTYFPFITAPGEQVHLRASSGQALGGEFK